MAGFWGNYIAIVEVSEENRRLREDIKLLRRQNVLSVEEFQELLRLRNLLRVHALRESPGFAARVIATGFGPNAPLRTITVDKGYAQGAIVGTPVISPEGVVGQVLRASPHAATILLLTDPGFRVSVMSQETRTPGILMGTASHTAGLEVAYVAQNAKIRTGELLVTAGVDGVFPKGIPVGTVASVQPGRETMFMLVHATPLVSPHGLEEVIILQPAKFGPPPLPPLVGPRLPDPFEPAEDSQSPA